MSLKRPASPLVSPRETKKARVEVIAETSAPPAQDPAPTAKLDNPQQVYHQLQEHGICVVPFLLENEAEEHTRAFFDEIVRPIRPEMAPTPNAEGKTPEDLTIKEMFYDFKYRDFIPGSLKGMYQSGCVQSQGVWDLRSDPRIVGLWAALHAIHDGHAYQLEEMLSSLDTVCAREPNVTKSTNTWYHKDGCYYPKTKKDKPELYNVQGFVTMAPMRKQDACLRVFKGSHKYHKEILELLDVEPNISGWLKFTPEQEEKVRTFLATKEDVTVDFLVDAPQGAIVMWDQRTIHMGGRGQDGIEEEPRMIVYTSYQPRSYIGKLNKGKVNPQKVLDRRIKAFEEGRNSTHECHRFKLFAKKTWLYSHQIAEVEKHPGLMKFRENPRSVVKLPTLSPLGRKLVGY